MASRPRMNIGGTVLCNHRKLLEFSVSGRANICVIIACKNSHVSGSLSMSTIKVQITYDLVTAESAEHGEAADHGFYAAGGWTYSIVDDAFEALAAKVGREQARADMRPEREEYDSIEEVVDALEGYGPFESSCSPVCRNGHCWVTQVQSSDDIDKPRLSFHITADDNEVQAEIVSTLCK